MLGPLALGRFSDRSLVSLPHLLRLSTFAEDEPLPFFSSKGEGGVVGRLFFKGGRVSDRSLLDGSRTARSFLFRTYFV